MQNIFIVPAMQHGCRAKALLRLVILVKEMLEEVKEMIF